VSVNCDRGTNKNAKGYKMSGKFFKVLIGAYLANQYYIFLFSPENNEGPMNGILIMRNAGEVS